MSTVVSRDGTTIAFTRAGQGPAVILVDGALSYRAVGLSEPLAERLRQHFTVYSYDRRGRGDSGDTAPYAPEREIEDLQALIDHAGGSAAVYGISSGAVLALEAARQGLPITRLALYEPSVIVDDTRAPVPDDYQVRLRRLLAAGRRGDAVRLFMSKGVGLPGIVVTLMRFMPAWSRLKAVAHTLPYDAAFVDQYQKGKPLPAGRWDPVKVPALVIHGGKSHAWVRNAARALAGVLPNAEHRTLEGQTHIVKPQALAPVLTEFFTQPSRRGAWVP
jgi:pimeloyl-ACP methyl ester carboxylesterase